MSKNNKKNDPGKKLGQAINYQQTGLVNEAAKIYRNILEKEPDNVVANHNLGIISYQAGEFGSALERIQKVLKVSPENIDALNLLGSIYLTKAELDKASDCYLKILSVDRQHLLANYTLGDICRTQGKYDDAINYYNNVLSIRADHGPACFYLADIYEKTNQLELSRTNLQKAQEYAFSAKDCAVLEAKLFYREGALAEALNKLAELTISENDTFEAACQVLFLKGKIYDRLGEPEKAFENFQRSNNQFARSVEASRVDPRKYLNRVKTNREKFSRSWIGSWPRLPDLEMVPSAFIVGFPRSGTTLLDQILDSHPGITVVEERPMIDDLVETFVGSSQGYPGALAGLGAEQVEDLRAKYLEQLGQYLPARQGSQLVVDKFPLNIVEIGLIKRIFPGAKIILAMRHPLDVCLSNFMQFFVLNDAMANFLTIKNTARLYVAVMDLWNQYEQVFDLDRHMVKYEDIVGDFETETRSLLAYLGVEWDSSVLEYYRKPTRKVISTPSYQDVSQPIYTKARFRWKRYRKFIEPIITDLEPFIEKFGYEVDL